MKKIEEIGRVSEKTVSIGVGFPRRGSWDTTLMTYVDDIPFNLAGMGEQNLFKTRLALVKDKSDKDNILLIEEPENHLSYSNLNKLLEDIANHKKQAVISSHSAFVVNKLGLDKVIMLNDRKGIRVKDLDPATVSFFKRLPGYDTLRVALSEKSILVEGPSDELVVQRAYEDKYGKLPIEAGIDVISVGTSALRFLEIAFKLNKKVAVVLDNDGKPETLESKYKRYLNLNFMKICFDKKVSNLAADISNPKLNYNTLESKMLEVNGLELLNKIIDKEFEADEELLAYMQRNKTMCALRIAEFKPQNKEEYIKFPNYIKEAIEFIYNA